MACPSQRRRLGALFVVLAAGLAAVAITAARAEQWVVAVAAGALALWLGSLGLGALRAGG